MEKRSNTTPGVYATMAVVLSLVVFLLKKSLAPAGTEEIGGPEFWGEAMGTAVI